MIALACAASVRVCGPPCTSVHRAPDGTCHLRRAAATRRTPPPATHPACAGQLDRGGLASVQGGDAAGGGGRGGGGEEATALAASGEATAAVLAAPDRPDRGQGHVGAAVRPASPPALPPSAPAPASGPSTATHPSPPLPSPQPARGVLWVEAARLLHRCGQSGGTARNPHEAARARRPRRGALLLERAPPPLQARAHLRRPRAAQPAAAALPLPGQRRRRRPHAVMAPRFYVAAVCAAPHPPAAAACTR